MNPRRPYPTTIGCTKLVRAINASPRSLSLCNQVILREAKSVWLIYGKPFRPAKLFTPAERFGLTRSGDRSLTSEFDYSVDRQRYSARKVCRRYQAAGISYSNLQQRQFCMMIEFSKRELREELMTDPSSPADRFRELQTLRQRVHDLEVVSKHFRGRKTAASRNDDGSNRPKP